MTNWKTWAPFQSKEQKDIICHLTIEEIGIILTLSKECGKKLGLSFLPSLIIMIILIEFLQVDFYIPIMIVIFTANLLFSIKFISIPYRDKQKAVLNNSKYAVKNKITV